jgi:hypothetical protein
MKISKNAIVMIVLIIWTVFSVFYISWFTWNNFKTKQLSNAANQGYQQGIVDVASAAAKCDSNGVPLNVGTDKDGKQATVTIFAASCLQQSTATTQQPSASQTAPTTKK